MMDELVGLMATFLVILLALGVVLAVDKLTEDTHHGTERTTDSGRDEEGSS